MDNLTIEQYLKDKQEIKFLHKSFKNLMHDNDISVLLGRISFFLTSRKEYSIFKSFGKIAEFTVTGIKDFSDYNCDEFKTLINNLESSFSDFLFELSSNIQLDIYFYGEDKYNLLNRKYLNLNIYKISDFYEVNYISTNKYLKKHFKILLLGKNVEFTSDFNINTIFDEIFDYNKLIEQIFNTYNTLYKSDYDFNYLKNKLSDIKYGDFNTIIVGNGYARTGIDDDKLSCKAVNLSLFSQDLPNSFALAKKAIESNPAINKCIIGVGYYSMYYDLTKHSRNDSGINLMEDLYKPLLNPEIFHNKHQMSLEDYITNPITLELFNMQELTYYMNCINKQLNSQYFNDNWTRENNSVLKNQKFDFLYRDDKLSLGIWRATQHNKLFQDRASNMRNLLIDFLDFSKKHEVTAILVVLPTTEYYNRFLDEQYEVKFKEIITELKSEHNFKFINLNEGYKFEDSDFIDVDHLNEIGCLKATSYLNNLLKWIKN